jgi:hypothetical protein
MDNSLQKYFSSSAIEGFKSLIVLYSAPTGTIEKDQVPPNISSEFSNNSTYCALL